MCHPYHLCFILSVILCIRAAYGQWDDYSLKREERKEMKAEIKRIKAKYSRRIEERVVDEISLFTLNYKLEEPKDVTRLVKFVKKHEKAFGYKTQYFMSKDDLYIHMKTTSEGKVGCAHLPRNFCGYICLIEEHISLW
ncbi:unnamed protein product [Cylicocyclus nassatus]|uniref:Uncharacterized protein n=1 Tax=Cylicocyclus nassatus TaxID=53992 RepID=A0AA36H548_CYLNA|nr:unnamed protein product [Cylicocyclus nassatus]